MLDKQIQILAVDTGHFYSNRESRLHWKNHKLRAERNFLNNKSLIILDKIKKYGFTDNEIKIIDELIKKDELNDIYDLEVYNEIGNNEIDIDKNIISKRFNHNEILEINELIDEYGIITKLIKHKKGLAEKTKNDLSTLLSNKVVVNISTNGKHHIRKLNENKVSDKNKISVFDSSFIRMMKVKPNEFTENFLVVQVYYYDVIKDLIHFGFTYKGEKYIYFTSSAGQIRTKKAVFVKESIWKKYERTIMCGLTLDIINAKGGSNSNKYLAYIALSNSATDYWRGFNIDKAIVIDDFETNVQGTYDLIDDVDYSIKRITGDVPITHTDGSGMILTGKNRMVRLPWIKGLLGKFDFIRFIKENNCSPVIKDIYGTEHNLIEEDIQIIFTKSQFKMWNFYNSWEEYKNFFKKYNCEAGYTNVEEDRIKNSKTNYQMLQTLTDMSDDELFKIAAQSIDKLNNMNNSLEIIKAMFGVTYYNTNKTYLQKSIELYPDLLNDEYMKIRLREIKDSLVKKYRSGKLEIDGKYTFLLPDFYAACEYWFMNISNPNGLLNDGEVFCYLYKKADKLDCIRSPHLYREHAVRKNIANKEFEKRAAYLRTWFTTDAIYTSSHDLISKILMFDVDGDKSLVVADKTLVEVAERNMQGIVPLYYNMKKAKPVQLNNATIYDGLIAAFTNGNIGQYSNNISKIWNSEVFISGSFEEQESAIDTIKLLCMENNFCIDAAKTLYMPDRPQYVKSRITEFTKNKLPFFFVYAKDKLENNVENRNNSLVNRLYNIIPNPRINCRKLGLGKIDYKYLMNNPKINCQVKFTDKGRLIKDETDPLILKYCELNKKYHFQLDSSCFEFVSPNIWQSDIKQNVICNRIVKEIKTELSRFGYMDIEIADILIKYLYGMKQSKYKNILWLCYGEIIYKNLRKNFSLESGMIQCGCCNRWFEVPIKNKKIINCPACQEDVNRIANRNQMRKKRKCVIIKAT